MVPFNRSTTPYILRDNYKRLGKNWEKRKKTNPNAKFSWGKGYETVLTQLLNDTQNHCAFCDQRPLRQIGATIEHFKPKSVHFLLAYYWGNLFPCCPNCQKKGEAFDKRLLKHDVTGFQFDDYFIFNYSTGELEPNPAKSQYNQDRALKTCELYRLNDFERPEERKQVLENYMTQVQVDSNLDKNRFSFRFMFP